MDSKKENKKKRLPVLEPVARKLYIFSGNKCAIENCGQGDLITEDSYRGKIAHIEAAMPGGARYNPEMEDEDRRAFDNLILVCGNCHNDIDGNESKYTVEELRKIKRNHEQKYKNLYTQFIAEESLVDYTEIGFIKDCLNTLGLYPNETDETNVDTTETIKSYFKKWERVPGETRQFASIVFDRGKPNRDPWRAGHNIVANYYDIKQACRSNPEEIKKFVSVLETHDLGYYYYDTDTGSISEQETITIKGVEGWPLFEDIKIYLDKNGYKPQQLFVDGDLSIFEKII